MATTAQSTGRRQAQQGRPRDTRTRAQGPIRLSWPLAGDRRRAVVGESPAPKQGDQKGGRIRASRMVHVLHQDMEMHYCPKTDSTSEHVQPNIDVPLEWNPANLEAGDQELLQHFQLAASRALAIMGHDPTELGNALIRTALAGNTASAKAVLQALLSFSALHRQGVHGQAIELKISAIRALGAASSCNDIGRTEAIQHVAAGMLIASFEIHQSSCTSGEWTLYVCGVKDVIKAAGLDKDHPDPDLAMLLDWVYYHDVNALFCRRHWNRKPSAADSLPLEHSCAPSTSPDSSLILKVRAEVSRAAPPAFSLMRLLAEVCDAVQVTQSPADMTPAHAEDHKRFLSILDWRIRSLDLAIMAGGNADNLLLMEVYQLAILVYLNRVTDFQPNQRVKTQQYIERAFTLFSQLRTCERQFPVFILGCEARTDEQRATALDLIDRTENSVGSRSFNYVRVLTEAIWAQDDLTDYGVEYPQRLTSALSRARIMPTFV